MCKTQFVICLDNAAYPASLESRKIYPLIPDPQAAQRGMVRLKDESGEDYLFPAELFAPIDLPEGVAKRLRELAA
ncbi:MAG: hypothetical protein HQL51_03335 [Magnetococcales bacterium]|nr:hypothetical protein [Magnetococcales bacterium]